MKLNPVTWLFGGRDKKPPVLLAVTPPRTGSAPCWAWRTSSAPSPSPGWRTKG